MSDRETVPPGSITVRICSYNRPVFLREALISVLNQTIKPAIIEIYDNRSSEDVLNHVKDLLQDDVKWVPAHQNEGGLANIARALHDAGTEFIYVMHDDDRLRPRFIERQVDFLNQHQDCVAVSCNAKYINFSGQPTEGQWHDDNASSRIFRRPQSLALFYAHGFLGFPSIVYRSRVADRLGFREHLGKVADAGLVIELAKFGRVAFQNEILLEYRVHSGQDSEYFSELIIKILYDHLQSYFSTGSRAQLLIRHLYRRRMKNTLFGNLIRGRSGLKEIWWVIRQRDWQLLALCILSIPFLLLRAYQFHKKRI